MLRSLTKVFALPGLRIGYLLAAPAVAAAVQACLPSWNVSAPAQAAGVVAARLLPDEAPRVRAAVAALRRALADGLATLGLQPVGAGGPFLLYQRPDAAVLCAALAERGVRLRHLASFGLADHVRIGVRPAPEQQRLVAIWRELDQSVASSSPSSTVKNPSRRSRSGLTFTDKPQKAGGDHVEAGVGRGGVSAGGRLAGGRG